MTVTTIILLVLLLCILFAILNLTAAAYRIEKAIRRVARILDRPRKELAELEEEQEYVHHLLSAGAANKEDLKHLEEIEEKIARRTWQRPQPPPQP